MAEKGRSGRKIEGEGSREADRRYREGVTDHLRKGHVEEEAEHAAREVVLKALAIALARHLVRGGARASVLGGRTFERAAELAASLGGRAAPFESLREELGKAEIVISGTGAPGIVITRADVEAAQATRRQRPLFLIDIAVPRDVDPEVAKVKGVFLYDLDDLRSVADANLRERRKEAAAAEAIVEREVQEFMAWRKSLDVVPLVVELRQRGEEIRRHELEKARARLGTLTPEQEKAIDSLTSSIVNKILHPPTVHLKEIASNGHAPEHVGFIRKLLGL
jgi:glutamyl-tRNA reductase